MGNILNNDLADEKIATLPEPYLSVVKRCVVKSVSQRAQTAVELIALLQGQPSAAVTAPQMETQVFSMPTVREAATGLLPKSGQHAATAILTQRLHQRLPPRRALKSFG